MVMPDSRRVEQQARKRRPSASQTQQSWQAPIAQKPPARFAAEIVTTDMLEVTKQGLVQDRVALSRFHGVRRRS